MPRRRRRTDDAGVEGSLKERAAQHGACDGLGDRVELDLAEVEDAMAVGGVEDERGVVARRAETAAKLAKQLGVLPGQ